AKMTKRGTKVQLIFDQQAEYAPRALELLTAIKNKLPPHARRKIGSCMFGDSKDVGPPLEAADLLAHCWYTRKQHGLDDRLDRQLALSGLMPGWIHRYGPGDFEKVMAIDLSPEQIAELRREKEP